MALEVRKRYPAPRRSRAVHKLPQRTLKRERRRRTARRAGTTALSLAVLAIIAGMAYTWYMGQHRTVSADQSPPTRSVRPVLTPHKIASDAPIGVAVATSTQEVKPGDNASITIRTNPEAECVIGVMYGTTKAVDGGLTGKTADEFGVSSWSWTVAAGSPAGKASVTVTCHNKKHSAVVVADMMIKP
mgnify:CR=1 FL=1